MSTTPPDERLSPALIEVDGIAIQTIPSNAPSPRSTAEFWGETSLDEAKRKGREFWEELAGELVRLYPEEEHPGQAAFMFHTLWAEARPDSPLNFSTNIYEMLESVFAYFTALMTGRWDLVDRDTHQADMREDYVPNPTEIFEGATAIETAAADAKKEFETAAASPVEKTGTGPTPGLRLLT